MIYGYVNDTHDLLDAKVESSRSLYNINKRFAIIFESIVPHKYAYLEGIHPY